MVVQPLSESGRCILDHVARYRLTIPQALANSEILATSDIGAAVRELRNLVADGWLREAPLQPGSEAGPSYFYLSVQAAALLGHDFEWALPVPHDARVECAARVLFCCNGKKFRQLLTKNEFIEKFSELWFAGQPVQYYLDKVDDRVVRLAYIKVDKGGRGRWERLLDSCDRFLRQRISPRKTNPAFADKSAAYKKLVDRGLFQFTILTPFLDKKRAIEIELERRQLTGKPTVPVQVHVVDELFELVFPPAC